MNSKKSPKKENEENGKNFAKALALTIICTAALFLIINSLVPLLGFTGNQHDPAQNAFYVQLAIALSSLTAFLLVFLMARYIEIYLTTKSDFTLGLIFLIIAMLADSITSNPLFHAHVGFMPMNGPFVFIPLFFTLLTSLVLIYLVQR